jgi:hypothetical protein
VKFGMNTVAGKTSLGPKRQAGAVHEASPGSPASRQRASVLDCGGPPPLGNEAAPVDNDEQEIPEGDGLRNSG